MADNPGAKWYAFYTKPRHEKKVAKALTERQIKHYLPLVSTIKQWQDRKKTVAEPLLKSYIFACIPIAERLNVLEVPGVVAMVKIGSSFPAIPQWQIDALQIFVDAYHAEMRKEPYEKFVLGQKVEAIRGPLQGISGRIIAIGKRIRFAVGIDSIRSSFSVEIAAEDIRKLD
jgi:transcriptional antiterminator RfaH